MTTTTYIELTCTGDTERADMSPVLDALCDAVLDNSPITSDSMMTVDGSATARMFDPSRAEIQLAQFDGTAESATPIIDWLLAAGHTARYHDGVRADHGAIHIDDPRDTTFMVRAGRHDWVGVHADGRAVVVTQNPTLIPLRHDPADGEDPDGGTPD